LQTRFEGAGTGRACDPSGSEGDLRLLPVRMAIARGRLPPDEARRTIANPPVITATGAGLCHPLTALTGRPGSGPSHTRDCQDPVSGA
jgi:hypothetical protein